MNVREYLDLVRIGDENIRLIQKYNANLVTTYPFILPINMVTMKAEDGYDFTYTVLDEMPEGWRIAFADDLLRELREELIKFNALSDYHVVAIKEKWGSLRWFDINTPIGNLGEVDKTITIKDPTEIVEFFNSIDTDKDYWKQVSLIDGVYTLEHQPIIERCNVDKIISKYSNLSERTCIHCGKPATKISVGWISPWCDECASILHGIRVDIDEWFKSKAEVEEWDLNVTSLR